MFYDSFIRECNKKGVKPSHVADAVGINRSNITLWKQGKTRPTQQNLVKLAEYFGCDISDLIEESGETATTQLIEAEKELDRLKLHLVNRILKADAEQTQIMLKLMNLSKGLSAEQVETFLQLLNNLK